MTFFLVPSKLISFLLSPVNWIIIVLVCRYFVISYAWRKRLMVLAVVIFLLFSNEFILVKVINVWQPKKVDTNEKHYDAGIVLGGFTAFDRNGQGYFNSAADRFVQTCKLYHQGTIKKIVVSGGSVWQNEPSEAVFVTKELIASGVRESDIIEETNSRNTYENAVFSRRILDSLNFRGELLLITSAIHLRRALGVFKKAGHNVTGYPCDYKIIDRKMYPDDLFLPQLDVPDKWAQIFKEMVGLMVYRIAGKAV